MVRAEELRTVVMRGDKEIVSAFRDALKERVGRDRFDVWFASTTRLELGESQVTVFAPSSFSVDWLRTHFLDDLTLVARHICGTETALLFRVDSSLRKKAREQANPSKKGSGKKEKELAPSKAETPALASPISNSGSRRRFSHFESYVVGPSNKLAVTSAQMVAAAPGAVTPFFLHGPTGVGKTHLLESVWSAVRSRSRRVVYLAAEQFTSYFLTALHGGGLPSFRNKYRDVDLLIIDDVQFFSGKRATIVEVQNTIDQLLREGRQIVLAADRAPAHLKELGPELTARLAGGLVIGMEPADEATRFGIAKRLADDRQLSLDESVLQWLAKNLSGDARQISGALHRLNVTREILGHWPTESETAEALGELIRQQTPTVRLGDIESAVCDVFGIDRRVLNSGKKTRSISHPRMLAMWLARKHTPSALSEIGEFFGKRSHSTVVSARNKVETWLSDGMEVELADRRCSIQDAILQVEHRLQAG